MKLLTCQFRNILGVKQIAYDLQGHNLFLIGGQNAQGKTSSLTALLMALCGKRGMDDYPELSLREGTSKGEVRIELTGDPAIHTDKLTVELLLRRKPSGLIVEEFRILDSEGDESPEPRELLKRLFTLRAFDPLEFERMKPKQQVELIRKMLGIDFEAFDTQRAELYEQRRQVGIEGKTFAAKLDGLKRHDDAPASEVLATDLLEELERRNQINEKRDFLNRTVQNQHESIIDCEEQVTKSHNEIARLKDLILKEEQKVANATSEIMASRELIAKCEADLASGEFAAQDVKTIREQIKNVDGENRKFRENREYDEVSAKAEELRLEYKQLTAKIERIDTEKAEAVASAPWPVEHMELTEDGILLNNRPFAQASSRERTIASAKVGMALNSKLRLLIIKNGSELDNEALDGLQQLLEDNDYQALVEIVTRTEEDENRCQVVIVDGEVKPPKSAAPAVATASP
jgi:hypothetical protein